MLYLAIGRRELGKTTLVYSLARRIPQRIIFDPRGMIHSGQARRASTPAEIRAGIEALYDDLDGDLAELIITPRDAVQEAFESLCAGVRDWIEWDSTLPLAVVFDEMRFVSTVNVPAFEYVLRCAPRDVVHVFMTCHRPKDVPVDVRAIADQWLIFHCSQRHDLREIFEFAGPDAMRQVQRLAPYEWLQWDDGRGTMRLHTTPSAWFVPLGAPDDRAAGVDALASMPSSDPMFKSRLFG
jgi:hypothetical protein